MTTVVNVKHGKEYDIYIGRGSDFGNPFKIGTHGNRAEVIEKYREFASTNTAILSSIDKIRGKRLGCHCAPLACHGDVLIEMAHTFYVSFGHGHSHRFAGKTLDKDLLLKVGGVNPVAIFNWANNQFERKYSNIYNTLPEMEFFPNGVIESGVFVK